MHNIEPNCPNIGRNLQGNYNLELSGDMPKSPEKEISFLYDVWLC